MSAKFEDIKIDRSFIREITLIPSKTVRMSILRAPQRNSEKQVSVLSDLKFDQVRRFRSNLNAEPWLEIISHHSSTQSDYLKQYFAGRQEEPQGESRQTSPDVSHFQIKCEEGEMDIIAEGFTCLVIEEIPHIGSAEPEGPLV